MKRYSTPLIIRNMQIKTTMRYHLTVVKIIIIKKKSNCFQGCRENTCALLMEMYIDAATIKNSTDKPRQIKNRTPYNSAMPLLGIYPKKTKTLI